MLEGNRLGGAMRTKMSPENRAQLIEFARTLPESAEQSEIEEARKIEMKTRPKNGHR